MRQTGPETGMREENKTQIAQIAQIAQMTPITQKLRVREGSSLHRRN